MAEAFCAWLLRPYLDLAPLERGPLHAQRVEECWRAFADPRAAYFVAQRSLAPGFRADLIKEAARPECGAPDPRALPQRSRTERWHALCDACDQWHAMPLERRARLLALLHALCLYDCVLQLVLPPQQEALGDAHGAEVAFWHAFARYMVALPPPSGEQADLAAFEKLALRSEVRGLARFNAALRVFVEKAKTGAPLRDLAEWAEHLEAALADTLPGRTAFESEILKSRFYRALGFIPQRQGDRTETVRVMDLAERHARAATPCTAAERILALENLHALQESRTKEALWVGDLDLALARASGVTQVDPLDAKAWAEVGKIRMKRHEWAEAAEAYAVAAILGPPASAIARHMAGVCLRRLGLPMVGALLFKDTLEIDPLSISAREALAEMPGSPLREAVGEWMARTVEL